ncbi:MAG TPA: type II secretion system protein [Desulfobacterales bacterium]|nr:type II secretion system protein [Desulfobacterales bacterium]
MISSTRKPDFQQPASLSAGKTTLGLVGYTRPRLKHRRAMTIFELLVVAMIFAVLFSLVLSGIHMARERAEIQHCQNNLRQLGMAFDTYMITYGQLPPAANQDDDNLRPLYPNFCNQLRTFLCEMSANQVRSAQDLENNPAWPSGYGHSYDYLSFYLYDKSGNPLPAPVPKTHGTIDRDPDREWLLMDSMEFGIVNKPDITDNHRDTGGNVLYADGHVVWIPRVDWDTKFVQGNSLR